MVPGGELYTGGVGEWSGQVSQRPRHFNSLHIRAGFCSADQTWVGGKGLGRGKENLAEGKDV